MNYLQWYKKDMETYCLLTTREANKQESQHLSWDQACGATRAFRDWYVSSFRLSLIINPNTFIYYSPPRRYPGELGFSRDECSGEGREWKIPLLFIFYLLLCINVCSPEQRKQRKSPDLASVHLTCKISWISIFPRWAKHWKQREKLETCQLRS